MSTYKTSRPIRVLNKTETCTCGCNGSDSWHRTHYSRVITMTSREATEGTIRLPFSTKPVRVFIPSWYVEMRTGKKAEAGYWVVDTDSIEFDKS